MPGNYRGAPGVPQERQPTIQEIRAKNAAIYNAGMTGTPLERIQNTRALGGVFGRQDLSNFIFTRAVDPNITDQQYLDTYISELERTQKKHGLESYAIPLLIGALTMGVGAAAGAAAGGTAAATEGAIAPLASQSSVDAFLATVPEAVPGTQLPVGGALTDITAVGAPAAAVAAGNAITPYTSGATLQPGQTAPQGGSSSSQPTRAPSGTVSSEGYIGGLNIGTAANVLSLGLTLAGYNGAGKPAVGSADALTPPPSAASSQAAKLPTQDTFKNDKRRKVGEPTALTGPAGIPFENLTLGRPTILGA
jgi:hypothetical protein